MRQIKILFFALISTLFIYSCEDDKMSNEKEIISFSIASVDAKINEADHTISLSLPYGTNVASLEPSIKVSNGALVSPASGIKQDFSSAVTYTVTAEDGTSQEYVAAVSVVKSTNNSILQFSFDELKPSVLGVINEEEKTISLQVPIGTDVTALTPNVAVSDDAVVSDESGKIRDFSKVVTYTVIAENGEKREYTVTVTFEPSGEKAITEFKFETFSPALEGVIDENKNLVTFTIPWNAEFATDFDITEMIPTISVSEGAAINPASGVSENFNYTRTYTVTAENGSTKTYSIDVNIEKAPEATVNLPLIKTVFGKDDDLEITGTNFTKKCQILIGNYLFSLDKQDITETSLKFFLSQKYVPAGEHIAILYVGNQEIDLGSIKILPPPPVFTAFNTSTSDGNKILEIRGKGFLGENYEVYFVKDGNEEKANIKSARETQMFVVIPPFMATGEYYVKVVTDGSAATSEETISFIMSTETRPVITGVSKTTVAGGEILEIYGRNFTFYVDEGMGVSVFWMNPSGPTKNIHGTVISDEKIEVVIDRDRLSSDKKYEFYLDFMWPDTSVNHYYNIQLVD